MECEICVVLEAIRCDRIDKYLRLVAELKRAKSQKLSELSETELARTLSNIESELNEAWKRLADRRGSHPNMAALQYRGTAGDLRRAICIHCAEELE